MVESDAQADIWAGLETAIEAFERGLDEYQTQFHVWSQDRRKLLGRETAMAEERTSASVRGLEERAQQLARDQEALAQDKAGLERFRAELDAFAAECDRRERASREREDSLGQKYSSHEETAASLQERTKQLDQRQCELQGRFEKSQQDLEERKCALAAAEKEIAEQRKRFDRDHQELACSREELARRESELASQSVANKEEHKKLALLSGELDARQKTLSGEGEGIATRRSQVDRRTEELSSLQSQLQALQAEIDTRTLALDADTQRLKQQSDVLAKREREFELTAAKSTAEHQGAAHDLERRERELADATGALAEREGELNRQQAKLEAALQSLRNDQIAVEKARNVVTEVDESRWSELNKVRAELNAMRTENELARARERELEGSLCKVQAANAREMHAAEDARTEAARLAEQLADEKRAAAEQRAAIFAQCLIAAGLKGPSADGEHEVLALMEGVKTKSAGQGQLLAADLKGSSAAGALVVSSPNESSSVDLSPPGSRARRLTGLPSDGATLLVQRQASHTAVATFWADFKLFPSLAGPTAKVSVGTKTVVADTTETESQAASSQEAGAQEFSTEEAVDTQASAMREAPAAARAEVEAAKHKEPTAARSGPKENAPSSGRKRKADNAPVQFTQETGQKPASELVAKQPAAVSASIDLDPATANRLRMMRRLNPTKSDQELLAKISAEGNSPGRVKQKKGWFALR